MPNRYKIILLSFIAMLLMLSGTAWAQFSNEAEVKIKAINDAEALSLAKVKDSYYNSLSDLNNGYNIKMQAIIDIGKEERSKLVGGSKEVENSWAKQNAKLSSLADKFYVDQASLSADYKRDIDEISKKASLDRAQVRYDDEQKRKEEEYKKQQDEEKAKKELARWSSLLENSKEKASEINDWLEDLKNALANANNKESEDKDIPVVGQCKVVEASVAHADANLVDVVNAVKNIGPPKCQNRYRFFIGGTANKFLWEVKNKDDNPLIYNQQSQFTDYGLSMENLRSGFEYFSSHFPEADTKIFTNLNRYNFTDSVKSLGLIQCGCENGYKDFFSYFILSDVLPSETTQSRLYYSPIRGHTLDENVSLAEMVASHLRLESDVMEKYIAPRVNTSFPYKGSWSYYTEEFPDQDPDSLNAKILNFAKQVPACQQSLYFIGRNSDLVQGNDFKNSNNITDNIQFRVRDGFLDGGSELYGVSAGKIMSDIIKLITEKIRYGVWDLHVDHVFKNKDIVLDMRGIFRYVANIFEKYR